MKPIPVDRLIDAVCDDGADFDDCLMGYHSARFDQHTGTLTVWFERAHEIEADEGDDYDCATYQFQLFDGPQ